MADNGTESIRSAAEELSREFKTLVDSGDLESLRQLQNLILGRLQDSIAVLSHFNEYSENCFAEVYPDFAKNTRLLKSMKSDLDYIFQKLRTLKGKIMATYPDAFPDNSTIEALDQRPDLELPRTLKGKIMETYPDAFPDNSTIEALDQRPDLELPR